MMNALATRLAQSYKLAKARQLATRPLRISAYYARHPMIKLNIGCGQTVREGWLNIDIDPRLSGAVYMDATRPLPLRDGSVDLIYSEHMIEHVPLGPALAMLRELHRVLRPEGMVRIATPDMDNIVRLKSDPLNDHQLAYVQWSNQEFGAGMERASPENPCYAINRMFHAWGHQFIYDRTTLASVLAEAGFHDVKFCEIGESARSELCNLEMHGSVVGDDFNRIETMVAEARH
jgi:SAM-dependent methyltransferase